MTKGEARRRGEDGRALLGEDGDFLRPLGQMVVQERLEAAMSGALAAAEKGERTAGRAAGRPVAGYDGRPLV